jgi:DNA-binding beta-propeller fold protein YncE
MRLSPDGRDIAIQRPGFLSAGSLAVTPGLGPIWVGNEIGGTVDIVDPSELLGPRLRGLGAPAAIALDPVNATAWIGDRNGSVRHFQSNGSVALPASLGPLVDPVSVATDPNDGAIWVTEFGGNGVVRFGRDGSRLSERSLLAPARVAVDSTNGEAWVTSIASGWVWRLSPALAVLDSFRLQAPVGVALDWRRRTAWICDVDGDQLVGVDMDTRAQRFITAGLGNPWDVAVDLANGEAWVVARGSSRGFRVSASGRQLTSVPGLGDPFAIRLDRLP